MNNMLPHQPFQLLSRHLQSLQLQWLLLSIQADLPRVQLRLQLQHASSLLENDDVFNEGISLEQILRQGFDNPGNFGLRNALL